LVCLFAQEFIIKQLDLTHNHAIDSQIYALYPSQRQPTGDLLTQSQNMLSTGSNPTLVTDFLHNHNCPVRPRDVHNLKQKLHFRGTPQEEIDSILAKPHITYTIDQDDSNTLQCVSFCTEQQKELAASYGDVILLDGTYRINKLRMPLYTAAVVDSESHGQPVAHALVAREDTAHIALFLQHIKEWFGNMESGTFIVDKDFAEINAIKQIFPNATIYLCRFHVLKAFMEEMKRQACTNDKSVYQV